MKIFARQTISQAVDTLVNQIGQGIHGDVRLLVRDKLPAIFEVACKQEEKRVKDLKAKTAEIAKINKEVAILQQKIKDVENWQQLTNNQSDLGKEKIISLLKYIEPRPIEPGKEIAYLWAFAEGSNAAYLEAFIVK